MSRARPAKRCPPKRRGPRHAGDAYIMRAQAWLASIGEMLMEKNRAYGNSAANPVRIFSRTDRKEQLRVRIDDKLSRIARGVATGKLAQEDVIADLVGYLALLAVADDEP